MFLGIEVHLCCQIGPDICGAYVHKMSNFMSFYHLFDDQ